MLLAALVHTLAYYVGVVGAVVIAGLVVVPALFFYGWRRIGDIPPAGPALKAWLLGRAVVVLCGACLVGAALLALRWSSSGQEKPSWLNPGGPTVAWTISLGLFVLGLALVFLGSWACGKLYNALCHRQEGRRVALYELGIPFGIAVFVQLMNLIVITLVGPAPVQYSEDPVPVWITDGFGKLSPADLGRIGGGHIPPVVAGRNPSLIPEPKGLSSLKEKPKQEPEQKPEPQDHPSRQLPSPGGLPGLSIPSQAPETLWGKAVYLVFRGYPAEAWQYAWAAYLLEESARVKSAAKWCSASRRPALLMPRIAVGVVPQKGFTLEGEQGRRLLGAFSMVELAGILIDLVNQFDVGPGNTLWVAYVREQKTLEELFAAARKANVDVALVLRVARKQRGNRMELEFQCQMFALGDDRPVWSSRKVTTSQYLAMKRQGTNLLREMGLETVVQFKRHFPLRDHPGLAPEQVPEYLEQLFHNEQVSVIEKVAVVKYLAEHGLLKDRQIRQAVGRITGKELELSRPNEPLKKWVQEQLPPLPVR